MNNKDLQEIYVNISELNIWNAKFKYFIWKNKKLILDELEIIEKSLIVSDKFKEYDTKRIELCKKHSNKDENWEAIMIDKRFDINDFKWFEKDILKLQEEFKETLNENDKHISDYEKLLNEETKLELVKVDSENIPDELSQILMDILIKYDLSI